MALFLGFMIGEAGLDYAWGRRKVGRGDAGVVFFKVFQSGGRCHRTYTAKLPRFKLLRLKKTIMEHQNFNAADFIQA